MASVTKKTNRDGTTSYQVRYRTPAKKQRAKNFSRRVDADRYARTVEVDIDRGQWIDPKGGKTTLSEWRTRFVATELGNRESTRTRDDSYWTNHTEPTLGQLPLASINYMTVQEWVSELSTRLAPATVQKHHQILSKTLAGAVKAGLIPANRAEGVDLPSGDRRPPRFLSIAEVDALAEGIDPKYRTLTLVSCFAGLRRGELFGLRRGRVDLMASRLEVVEQATEVRGFQSFGPLKSKAGHRRVPLPRRLVDELIPDLAPMSPDALVWTAPKGGPLRSNFRSRVWVPAVNRAGLDGLTMHDMRHTAVSFWIAAGATLMDLKTWAGHSSVQTTIDVYGHLLPGTEDPVMAALDAMQSTDEADVIQLRR